MDVYCLRLWQKHNFYAMRVLEIPPRWAPMQPAQRAGSRETAARLFVLDYPPNVLILIQGNWTYTP